MDGFTLSKKAKVSSLASKCEPVQNNSADCCVGEKIGFTSFVRTGKMAQKLFSFLFQNGGAIVAITASLTIPSKHKPVESLAHQRVCFY